MNLVNLYKRFKPSYYQAFKVLTIHVGMLSSTLYAMWYYKDSYISLITIPFLGLLNLKSSLIFHDCGHDNCTPSKQLNYIIGSIMGIILLVPFAWTYDHHIHHLTSGNNENNFPISEPHKQNETIYHTFNDYKNMNKYKKKWTVFWREYMFYTLIPLFAFSLWGRFDIIYQKIVNNKYKESIQLLVVDNIINSLCIPILYYFNPILYHYLLSICITMPLILSLNHNEHTFNPPYVSKDKEWTKQDSGLKGSSFIQVPKYLKFFTYGIEYHHIHHMIASIPGYNLKAAHEYLEKTEPEFKNIVKLSMTDCYHNLWLTLYDEENDRYISFKEADEKIKNA